jgi:hypothetical protein
MKDEYVRKQDAIDDLHTQLMYRMGTDDMKRRLDDWVKTLPSADVVQVVRCDDCVYYGSRRWCELHSSVFDDNAFCSYGERREESDNG